MHCFVMMPFANDFDDVYDTIKQSVNDAVPGEQINCHRLDESSVAGKISDQLVQAIAESTICIADLTTCNPNVMWEVGYAMALRNPLVTISQEVHDLPFDLKDWKTVSYDRKSLAGTLRKPLSKAFRETLGYYQVRREQRTIKYVTPGELTIAVTGSMDAELTRCKARVGKLLEPYLGKKARWLCGSFGAVDEIVVEFLASNNETVQVIGYDAFDVSSTMLDLLEANNISFLDPQSRQLPVGINAPSERDLIFLTKADLLVMFWNGESSGTKAILDWYMEHEKNLLVGFV